MTFVPITRLITHSGQFHPDEVMSSVVLSTLYPTAKIIRTRDKEIISSSGNDTIIYDVGMVYDPEAHRYDHHQPEAPLRENGMTLSSFGLIWQHFGDRYLEALGVPEEFRDPMWRSIDRSIVASIDMGDNGELEDIPQNSLLQIERYTSLNAVIGAMNPSNPDATEKDRLNAFRRALTICKSFLEGTVDEKTYRFLSRARLDKLIQDQWGKPILVMDFNAPYEGALRQAEADHVKLVIHPCDSGYMLKGVRKSPGTYDLVLDLPEAWAGLEDGALDVASGVDGCVFCHRKRFLAVNKTLEGALEMAEATLMQSIEAEPAAV